MIEILSSYGYYFLFILAVFLNINDKDSLLITLLVGFSALIPMQYIQNYYLWYAICIGMEVFKIFLSYNLKTRIKYPIIFLCGLMVLCHVLSYVMTFILPYKVILPALEYLEIASCALFSIPVLLKLKRKIKWIHYK